LAPIVSLPFAIWARISGIEARALTDAETEGLSNALLPVLTKYAPRMAGAFMEETALIIFAAAVIMPRLMMTEAPAEEQQGAKKSDDKAKPATVARGDDGGDIEQWPEAPGHPAN